MTDRIITDPITAGKHLAMLVRETLGKRKGVPDFDALLERADHYEKILDETLANGGADQLMAWSKVASRTLEPLVGISWGDHTGELDAEAARAFAENVLRAREAAISDCLITRFLDEKVGIPPSDSATVLQDFRRLRLEHERDLRGGS